MGPSAFIPVHKLLLHDKLSMYSYELCMVESLGCLLIRILFKLSDTPEAFSNLSRQCL